MIVLNALVYLIKYSFNDLFEFFRITLARIKIFEIDYKTLMDNNIIGPLGNHSLTRCHLLVSHV